MADPNTAPGRQPSSTAARGCDYWPQESGRLRGPNALSAADVCPAGRVTLELLARRESDPSEDRAVSEHQGQIDPTNLGDLLRRAAEAAGLDLSSPWVWLGLGLAAAVIASLLFYVKSYIGTTAAKRAEAKVRESTKSPEVQPAQVEATTRAAPRPHQLPSDLPDFTGRDEAFRELMARLRGDEAGAAVSAVGGMGGVGKSALAIYVAHRVAEHYPVDIIDVTDDVTTIRMSVSDPAVAARLLLRLGDSAELVDGFNVAETVAELRNRILERYLR